MGPVGEHIKRVSTDVRQRDERPSGPMLWVVTVHFPDGKQEFSDALLTNAMLAAGQAAKTNGYRL